MSNKIDTFTEVTLDQKSTLTCIMNGEKFVHASEVDRLNKEIAKYKAAFEILKNFKEMIDITLSYDDVFENVERCKIQAIGHHSIEAKKKVQEIMEG